MKLLRYQDVPQYPRAYYEVDVCWDYLQDNIDRWELDTDPVFQRAHVWTEAQQSAFVEWRLRGGESGRSIYINHPGAANSGNWMDGQAVLVDGKQRVEAILKFMRDELVVMGQVASQFGKTAGMDRSTSLRWHVGCLKTEREVIEWYLLFNAGGTPHTPEEIARVRDLL